MLYLKKHLELIKFCFQQIEKGHAINIHTLVFNNTYMFTN